MNRSSESEKPTIQNGMWLLVRRLGSLSGTVVAIGAIASVVYDWGFFVALRISFEEAPTTLTDHIHSWLIWLPLATIAILFIVAQEFFLRRVERGMTEEEIVMSSPWPHMTRIIRNSPHVFISWLAIFCVVAWLLFGPRFVPFVGLCFGLMIAWFIFSTWVFSYPTIRERHSNTFAMLFRLIPPFLILMFTWGHIAATNKISSENTNYLVSINSVNGSSTKNTEINLIRAFDDWILIGTEDKQVAWLRLRDVTKLERIEENGQFQGIVCIFSDTLCPGELSSRQMEPW